MRPNHDKAEVYEEKQNVETDSKGNAIHGGGCQSADYLWPFDAQLSAYYNNSCEIFPKSSMPRWSIFSTHGVAFGAR